MLTQLLDHNTDLKKLKDDGYNISIINDNIVINGIPYVNKDKKILFGTIYCPFNLLENKKITQNDHTVRFTGEHPCDQSGNENTTFVNNHDINNLTEDIIGRYYLSSKPDSGAYPDFYEKMKKYVELLCAPAKSIDPSVKCKNFDYVSYTQDSVFKYPDTNTARAEITSINNKVKDKKIAIIGLGGTGSFILDYISKTPVSEIALFDKDQLKNHNAFRMPGAVHLNELSERQSKISYLKNKYEQIRSGIHCFEVFINEDNVDLLSNYDFVFIAIDENSKSRGIIANFLIESEIPFIDVGMGVTELNNSLRGLIRKTMITQNNKEYLNEISTEEEKVDVNNIYRQNIQLIELNALNAALAVISWKKYFGFYNKSDNIYHSTFIIDEEEIINAP